MGSFKMPNLFFRKLDGISTVLIVVASVFKIMHWPKANTLLIVGLSTFAVSQVMRVFSDHKWTGSAKTVYEIAHQGYAVTVIAVLFLLMHWPFGAFMLGVAIVYNMVGLIAIAITNSRSNASSGAIKRPLVRKSLIYFGISLLYGVFLYLQQ